MELIKRYLTRNDVYANNLGRIDSRYAVFQDEGPKGAMLHSVGYVQPNAEPIIKVWDKPGKEKAVHAFIEPDCIYQTLPWNFRGWHAGGSANNTHIGVEMCEPPTIRYTGGSSWVDLDPAATEAFVRKTYAKAVELFAFLCREFGWDPLADGIILSHAEGHKQGVASNHGDPEHIWKKFGLSMDLFRADVAEAMKPKQEPEAAVLYRVQVGAYRNRKYAEETKVKLKAAGFDAYIKSEAVEADPVTPVERTGMVTVSSALNIRSGPGVEHSRTGKLENGDKVTIVEEKNGWGELQQGGWVCLDYITYF